MNKLNKNQVLVTVGIPSFERPIMLRQAIKSVINQTYRNLEMFICDDASKQYDIKTLINDLILSDSRIKFFQRMEKPGLTENINYMVKLSSGKYFLWLCDDDWIDPDYIEKCLAFIESHSDYVIVTGATKFYLGDKFLYNAEKINVENANPVERFLSFYEQALGTANCPDFGLIPRELMLETPLKNILGHDNILVGNLVLKGKIKTLDSVFINRRLGGSSETLKKSAVVNCYSLIERYLPFFALYFNLIFDILIFKSSYKKFTVPKKILLAIQFTLSLIKNFTNIFSKYLFFRCSKNFEQSSDLKIKQNILKSELLSVD